MKNFIEKEFIKYYLGNTKIRNHVDAVHAVPPYADQFTGEIVMGLINKINCSGIISKVSRKKIDLNRRRDVNNKEAIDEYRNAIHSILTYLILFEENNQILKQPYLHLAIHGMKDTHNKEIIIGTRHGESCSSDIKRWIVDEVSRYYENIIADQIFPGDS
jgi:N-formylglutamate amidohydrolase